MNLGLGLRLRSVFTSSGGAAPSGIPVASTNTIIVVDTEIIFTNFAGTYQKESSTLYRNEGNAFQVLSWNSAEWVFSDDDAGQSRYATPPSNNINYIATTGWPTQTLTAA